MNGFERQSDAEFLRLLYVARGSLNELLYFLLLSKNLEYLKDKEYLKTNTKCNKIGRLLNGLINSLKRKNTLTKSKNTNPKSSKDFK